MAYRETDHEQEERIRRVVREELEAERIRRLQEEASNRRLDRLVREAFPHFYRKD